MFINTRTRGCVKKGASVEHLAEVVFRMKRKPGTILRQLTLRQTSVCVNRRYTVNVEAEKLIQQISDFFDF
jgi:hypothetical protein